MKYVVPLFSYTNLLILNTELFEIKIMFSINCVMILSYTSMISVAVSYTHLDVYKRQVWKRSLEKSINNIPISNGYYYSVIKFVIN